MSEHENGGVSGDGGGAQLSPNHSGFLPIGWTARPAVADSQPAPVVEPEPEPAEDTDDDRETGPAARRKRYRERHTRYDYVPSPEANDIVDRALAQNVHLGVSRVIDHLVIAAAEHFTHCTDSGPADTVEQATSPGRAS